MTTRLRISTAPIRPGQQVRQGWDPSPACTRNRRLPHVAPALLPATALTGSAETLVEPGADQVQEVLCARHRKEVPARGEHAKLRLCEPRREVALHEGRDNVVVLRADHERGQC